MKSIKSILIWNLLALVTACGSGSGAGDSSNDSEEAIQAGISILSGALNAGNEETTSIASLDTNLLDYISGAFSVEASVTSCGVAAMSDTCSSGSKSATYTSCRSQRQTYSGTVSLSFSDSNCSLSSIGNSVTRQAEMTRTGFFNSTIQSSAENHEDYRGNTIGGGSKLTRTGANEFELEVLGVRKTRTRANGSAGFDVQSRTIDPLTITGELNGNRTISAGSLEVIHNRLEYVTTFTFDNVQYRATECCYPVGGTLTATYSGTVTGSSTITFDGCGSAIVTRGEQESVLSLPGCE